MSTSPSPPDRPRRPADAPPAGHRPKPRSQRELVMASLLRCPERPTPQRAA